MQSVYKDFNAFGEIENKVLSNKLQNTILIIIWVLLDLFTKYFGLTPLLLYLEPNESSFQEISCKITRKLRTREIKCYHIFTACIFPELM